MDTIDWLARHGGSIGLGLTWLGIAWVYLRRRLDWHQKQFRGQVNFSLNYVVDGTLAIRTLLETSVNQVWLNEYGIKLITAAAQRTSADQPFILLANPTDMQFINRAALNALSQHFASTYLARSLGIAVRSASYVFGITFERNEEMRTLKFRVLLMEENALKLHFGEGGAGESIAVTHPVFKARLKSLKAMHALHRQGLETGACWVDTVELGVVVP